MPLTPLSDTSGFVPLSDPGFVSPESSPSLLESKQQQVAATSEAKKQALDPSSSIDPSLTSYNDLSVTDGDTLRNKLNGEIYRLTQGAEGDGFRYNTFESNHGDNFKTDPARMLAQKQAIAKVDGLPSSYIPDSAVLNRGEKAKDIFGKLLEDTGNISINPTGKIDKYGRTVAEAFAPGSDQSLLSPMNTSELNADYATKYNERQQREDRLKEFARREKATQFSVSDANRETLLGGIANAVAGGAVAASDQIYNMAKAPFELGQQLRGRGITNKQRELSSALTIKQEAAGKAGTTYTPTAEEQAILETPTQAFMRETVRPVLNGERDITARDLLVGLTNVGPFQQNTHEKLQQSAFIKENITDRLTAYQEGARKIYNSGGSDELFKDSKALYTDSIEPTFVEGVQKFKGGHVIGGVVQKANEVDGVIQVADAIANAGVGIFRVAANNPQAVAEEIVKQIPNSIAASKALLQTFLGMYTNTASEVTTSFIKEHGRHPEGAEVDNIQINSALSAIADSYADKMIVSKPGVARAVVREGLTESGQSFLEQDAAKQGASKIDFAEVYASGVIGSLAGGGTNVATHPEAALIEAAQGVGTIAKGAISGAKKAGPTIQWAAQAVGDAGREYGNVMPDGMVDATKAGLAKLTGALTGMPTDSLGSGLKAAGSLAAHATKEGAKAVGGAVGDYLDSAFPITSQAVKDFKVSNLVPDKISNAVDAAKQAVTDAAGEVGSSTTTDTPEGRKAFVVEASLRNDELFKELTAIGTKANPTNAEGARFTELLTTIRKNKETIDGIKAKDAQDDTTDADIVTATTKPTDPATDPAIALQAVDRVIRSMRQSKEVSPEKLIAFEAFKTKATLTPEQTSVTSAFIATQTALATVKKNASVVRNEVIYGQKAEDGKKGFLGMVEHQAIISDALDQENIPAAQSALGGFKAFAASQVKKAASLTAMSVAAQAKKYSEVKALEIQFREDFPTFQGLKNQASTAFEKLANTVGEEADMLSKAVAEAELHFKLGTTEAKAVPVKQESGLLTPVGSEFPNAPSEYKIDNIDEMIATNGGVPAVSQFTDKGYQSVNFKDFHLSIDNENKSAEVAKVELGTEERGKGHGINAYKALGDALAERGITLTSSEAQYADGKNMWHKLVKQGHAVKKGSYFEYIPTKPAIESKPAPVVDPTANEVTHQSKIDALETKVEARFSTISEEFLTLDRGPALLPNQEIRYKELEKQLDLVSAVTNIALGNDVTAAHVKEVVAFIGKDFADEMLLLRKTSNSEGSQQAVNDTTVDTGLESALVVDPVTNNTAVDQASNATAQEVDKHNKELRHKPEGGVSLRSNLIPESNNILYRPDRAYRAIGTGGYNDFLQNKVIRSKLDGKTTYENDYYSKGSTENRYTKGDRGKYVVEAVTDNQWNNADNGYLSAPKNITENSKIRIHERQADGSYKTVFDNINDQAYLNRDATAQATETSTAVDQVTTDTSGNAEEESVTDPVTIVADATPRPEPISKEAFNKLSEEEQNKHLGNRYNEGYGGQFTIGDKVISEEHGPGVIKTGGGRSKWVVNFDSGIEANVPDNTLDVKEVPSPVVETTADTAEVVYDLAMIKDLALKKNYSGRTNLITAVNVIFRDNSLDAYTAAEIAKIGKALEGMENKSLGDYLLDSARKFIGDKTLRDYYSAKVLDKVSKYSALLTTPNFFSTLKDKGVKDALGLTPEQLNGLDKLTGFVNKFAETFKKDTFTDARLAFDITTLLKNPALYFMKETGRDPFDENFVSTLATVGYSWVANNANSLIEHSDEGINSLLGRDSKHKISDDERLLLSDKQILKSALITSLGKEVVSSLGITFNTKADGSIESKMIEALGIYVVNTLEHMDVLAKTEAIHKDIHLALKKGEAVSQEVLDKWEGKVISGENAIYFTGVATTVTPVVGKSYSNTELAENVQAIVDDNRQSKGLLTELFGYAQQRALPLLEAPTLKNMPNIIKRGIKRIPERMRKALHKYASNGFTINMDNHSVYSFLEPEQRLQMLGYNETLEGVHAVNIKSVQGTNRTSKNEVEAYDQLIEHLDQQEGKLATPMYFLSSVWKSGRAGMEGLINPQASKFHRHMLGMAAWESTIDSPAKLKLFKIAVAEALGSKVDRQGDETSIEAFDRLRNQPEIRDGVATIKYLKSGVEMSAEEKLDAQEAILAAIEKGRSKTHTLEALTALATYSETEPFTTRMSKEVDGVTNGVIIGLIQLMSHRPKKLLEFLKAGGLSEDKNFVYGEWIAKVGNFDNYQRMASSLIGYKDAFYNEIVASKGVAAKDRTKTANAFIKAGGTQASLDGLDFFVGALMKDDNLTKEARDLAKNPLMITSYGSAMKNVIEGLGKDIIANFYSKLEDASDNQEALDEIARQLNNILGTEHKILKTSYLLDVEDTNKNEALKFKLNKADTAKFQELVATSIGVAMSDAITEHFQPFIDKRKELNNAMNLVHAAFMIKYDAAYSEAALAKGVATTTTELEAYKEAQKAKGIEVTAKEAAAFMKAKEGRVINLSREEVNALVKTLEPSMASFDHAMSDGEMDTELFVAKNESKTNLTDDYRVQVTSKKPLKHKVSYKNKQGETVIKNAESVTARGSVSYFGFPGVGSVIKAIHSSDGAVQYKLMETSAVLNVHDADLAGIDGTMAMTQRQNLAFKEVMEDYSMRASIQKTLLRAMKALTEDEWYVLNEQLQITDDKAEGFLGHGFVKSVGEGDDKITVPKYESVHAFVDVFTDTTKRDLAAKKALLASLKSWGQYNLNHGAYVTEEESEALFAAIDELRDSLERDDAESNAAIQAELAHMENAERNRINDQIKSSATEDIDIANFVADFKPITVSASTVNSIFDELGKIDKVTDFPSHTEHLRTVLNESIRQVLNPMELLVRKLGKANSGVLAKGKIYLSMGSTGRLHTTDQSAQEVYAHELVHAVTEAALSSNYWLRKQARSLYEKVQDQITPESFLDYDAQGNVIVPAGSTLDQTIAKAKAVHDHIFDNNDITKVSYKNPITNEIVPLQYSNGLLEFVAMGTTNAKFIKILAGINTNKSKRDVLTYADRVYNLFVGAINSVTSLINKTKDPAANVALMILMHKLANANQVKSNIIMRKFEENGHLEDIVNSKLYKALAYSALKSGEILKARKNKTLSAVGEMIGLSQDTSFEAYKKVAGKLARKHGITHENILSKLVTEAEGITAISAKYMHKLAKSNMLIDQLRRLKAQSVTNQILGSFIAGTPTKSEGIAITKVMLKTDMSSLIDSGYTWDKMFGLLKSRSKRLAEIATVEKLLQAAAPTNFDYYKTQAASLGYMLVNGQPLKWGTKINAVNIAHLGGTGKKVEGDLKVIEGYLDILASLHAIKYSDAGHVTDFVTVAEREFAKDKDNNGVMLSYLVHKDLKARALEQSFEGQKEQMFKGYTKEIYNPRVSIEVAPDNAYLDLKVDKLGNVISTEAKMKAKGYIKVRGAMTKDPTDLNKEPMSLYVNKDGDTATFNKMIVSLTSDRRKGHDQGEGYSSMGVINPALIGSWDTTLATKEGQKILARADYADLSKIDSNNLLVPVENAQHEIVGYRYLMHEGTKDDLLEKENDFAKVLGAMEGSIVDKQNSKQINNEVVNLMRKDFLDNYNKDPDLFIKFSPHSQDADERELYAMLPADMRKEIKKVWKSDVMYVRANMFRTIFGFRKFTVTEGSKEQDEMNAMHDGVLTNFRIALRDKLRTPTAKKVEIALQEIAKEVKDSIVIKLPDTLYNNVISNNLLLWAKGLGRSAIIKDQAMFLDAARQYHKDVVKLMELERSVRINPKLQNSANVKAKINSLKDHMANNPIAFLMDSGVSQTIIEDVDTDESKYTYKGMIEEKLAPLVSRVPKPLKTLASIAYMTHDTKLYKFLREATQLSDLVARATLHKHNTEKKGMSFVDSINDIKDTFIDYDAPTSKEIQYLNDTNFLMFTKFFIRSQKVIYQTYANAPARALSLLGFEEAFGEMSTINDSNIINTSILGKINFPLALMDDLVVPHTASLLDLTGAGGGSYTPE